MIALENDLDDLEHLLSSTPPNKVHHIEQVEKRVQLCEHLRTWLETPLVELEKKHVIELVK